MVKQCLDSYSVQFNQFPDLLAYHEEQRKASLWERSEVKSLRVAALDTKSPLYEDKSGFDPSVSQEAIADTAENLGLAIRVGGRYFPLRDTAYKSLLDRAKINGTALPKLARLPVRLSSTTERRWGKFCRLTPRLCIGWPPSLLAMPKLWLRPS